MRNRESTTHNTSTTPAAAGEEEERELFYAQLKFSQIFQLHATLMKTTHLSQSILIRIKLYTALVLLVLSTDTREPVQWRKKPMTFLKVNCTEDLQSHIYSREEKEGEDRRKTITVKHQYFYPLVCTAKLNYS